MHFILTIIQIVAGFGAVCSSAYYLMCLWGAADFLRWRKARERARPTSALPPASILKPLKGTDPEMYESFRSHCLQDYPSYEILFGVSDAKDPAAQLVEKLRREFPRQSIRLVLCEKNLGENGKVSSLAQLAAEAKYSIFLVNDSDI